MGRRRRRVEVKVREHPPAWFQLDRYDFDKTLEAEGWFHALKLRYQEIALCKLLRAADPRWSYMGMSRDGGKDGGIVSEQFFERYMAKAQSPRNTGLIASETLPRCRRASPLEICRPVFVHKPSQPAIASGRRFYAVDLDGPDSILISGFEALDTAPPCFLYPRDTTPIFEVPSGQDLPYDFVASDSMRLFTVDGATAEQRLDQFKARLKIERDERNEYGSPLRRRGSMAFHDTYSPDHGRRWRHYHILAVLDLDLYYLSRAERRPIHEELGHWFQPEYRQGDPQDWGRETRETIRHAWSCLFSLEYINATNNG